MCIKGHDKDSEQWSKVIQEEKTEKEKREGEIEWVSELINEWMKESYLYPDIAGERLFFPFLLFFLSIYWKKRFKSITI